MKDTDNNTDKLDHASNKEFYDYYAQESISHSALFRLKNVQDTVVRVLKEKANNKLDVVDIGCGAGTLSILWAAAGHDVHGLDVNESLVKLAEKRAKDEGYDIDFRLGTATQLPWDDESMDVCMVPELLEHVAEWEQCLDEFSRILCPGGILFLSTDNKLCPKQQEFTLLFYSWYPGPIKRYCEKLAKTTHPQIAGYAKYPAVNWFSFYSLRTEFGKRGMRSLDRFDLIDFKRKGKFQKLLLSVIRKFPPARFLGHIASTCTVIVGIKHK